MANLQSLTVNDIGNLTLPSGTSSNRPSLYSSTAIKWTNTGTQAYTVLSGTTPTLTSTSWTAPVGVTSIEVLVVAGGGSGAAGWGGGAGGGGAGGLIYNSSYAVTPGTSYTVTVGAGGTPVNGTVSGNAGGNSVFGTLTALGGGGGGTNGVAGQPGGSGGGSGEYATNYQADPTKTVYGYGGAGTAGQGFKGGDTLLTGAGSGGGGAGGAGINSVAGVVGAGGPGLNFSITGTPTWYAAGGGASGNSLPGSSGGSGIGGNGGPGSGGTGTVTSGTASTGSGGGGTYQTGAGTASGGSGIVVIRYSLATATTQPIGQLRFNTDVNKVEHYGSNNSWIATDGPLLNLDVGNTASYSGSGTSWNDLANGNTFTLTGSPTYGGSGASAYLSFNGSTQYAQAAQIIDFSSSIFTQGFTLEAWCYPTGVQSGGNSIMFSTAGGTGGYQWQNYFWYNQSNYFGTTQRSLNYERVQVQNDFFSTFSSPINNWYHVVVSCNNQHSTLYVNGVQAAANFAGQPSNTPYIISTNSGSLATRVSGFVGYNTFVGRIAVIKVYNRGITPDEVLQNFNALRGRYGV